MSVAAAPEEEQALAALAAVRASIDELDAIAGRLARSASPTADRGTTSPAGFGSTGRVPRLRTAARRPRPAERSRSKQQRAAPGEKAHSALRPQPVDAPPLTSRILPSGPSAVERRPLAEASRARCRRLEALDQLGELLGRREGGFGGGGDRECSGGGGLRGKLDASRSRPTSSSATASVGSIDPAEQDLSPGRSSPGGSRCSARARRRRDRPPAEGGSRGRPVRTALPRKQRAPSQPRFVSTCSAPPRLGSSADGQSRTRP